MKRGTPGGRGQEVGRNYHILPQATRCPFCGLALLEYKRPGHHGNIYQCRTVVHRRQKGSPSCGLTPVLSVSGFGRWEACQLGE